AAGEEARRIAGLFPDATLYRGAEATLARAEKLPEGTGTIHFATHGQAAERVNEGYLKLADGPLTLEAIYHLPLKASGTRTAVLSACQTAVAQKDPGTDVLGLAHAFALAGAATVVSSLWDV